MNNRNPLAEYQKSKEKRHAFAVDQKSGCVAYKSNGTAVPLQDLSIDNVEFIGGRWRVQDMVTYNIRRISDRDIIIGEQIPCSDLMCFDYYRASRLVYNCYGPLTPKFDLVVACFVAGDKTYWAYGTSTTTAGATLAMRMCEEYKYLLRTFAQRRTKKKSR